MVIYKYIGRRNDFKGKTLWEILGNLKDFGVGRVVVRSMFERYPEKSFMKILKVQTIPQEKERKIQVWVEKTFRGRTFEKPYMVYNTTYKPDYRLIPKDEEEEYCKITAIHQPRAIPNKMECPPFLKEYLKREMENKSQKYTDEDFLLPVQLNKVALSNYYPVEVDSKNVKPLPSDIRKPIHEDLFK